MGYLGPTLVIVAALVALAGLMLAQKPGLKATFDKLVPYQGVLGVGVLAWGVWDLLRLVIRDWFMGKSLFGTLVAGFGGSGVSVDKVGAASLLGYIVCSILLGATLGFGLRSPALHKRLLPYAVLIGYVGVACALIWLIKGGGGVDPPSLH